MHSGIIRDAETQEPLDNAIVNLQLDYTCYFPPNPAGPNSEPLGNIEAKTDSNGKFVLPLKAYLMPPLLCFADKNLTYAKAGYFKTIKNTNVGQIDLFRMNHYLNYLPYKSRQSFLLSSDFEERSKLFRPDLDKLKKIVLEPLDDIGIFLRLPGRKITQIHVRAMALNSECPNNNIIYYAQDDMSKEWLTFDSRGKMLELKSDLPKWDFLSTEISWGWPLYATHDSIFYPLDENPTPSGLKYKKGELKYIPPQIGNITALVGFSNSFFTIEDNGKVMCPYGQFINLNCVSGNDLPIFALDDDIKNSVFKYAVLTLNHGMFIVTRTSHYWHIYKYKHYLGPLAFTEIYAVPLQEEITAFTATGNSFYVAFKNDGLRKYDIIMQQNTAVKEDTNFALNAHMTRDLNIKSLIVGRAVNVNALYVTVGEDKIYRFSMDGIPDYIIKQ